MTSAKDSTLRCPDCKPSDRPEHALALKSENDNQTDYQCPRCGLVRSVGKPMKKSAKKGG